MSGERVESRWLVDPAGAYLNHGGFGALPVEVADAADRLRAQVEGNPTDLLTRQWQGRLDDVRGRVAAFVNAPADELVFVPNATTGTASVLASLPWLPGDEVVCTDHRYLAVARQLDALADRHGVRVIEVGVPVDVSSDDAIVDLVMSCVGARTKLLVVDQIGSPTGLVFPVAALARAAHAADVPILVDAAHAPGQVDVDLAVIGADFWVGNMHKWVCSPRAAAVLRVAPRWQPLVRPLVPSHDYAVGFRPAFDWTGTLDPVPLLTIPAALDYWESLGWAAVRARQHALASDGAGHIAGRLGTCVAVRDELTAAMRLVELPRPLDHAAADLLAGRLTTEHGVTLAVPSHQGRTYARVCGQLYNRPDDYVRAADALAAELGTDG